MTDWTTEYLQLIEDCENREDRLTDWERGFVGSIRNQLEASRPLSTKQTERLNEIWERVTSKG